MLKKIVSIGVVIFFGNNLLMAEDQVSNMALMQEAINLSSDTVKDDDNLFTLYDAEIKSNNFEEKGHLKIFSQDIEGLVTTLKEGNYWFKEYSLNGIRRDSFIQSVKDSLASKNGTILYQGQDYLFFKLYEKNTLYWGKIVYDREKYIFEVIEEKALKVVKKTENLILKNIHFDSGKATLKKGSEGEIKRVLDFLNKDDSIKVEIQGHTDSSGKAESNLKLSQRRAETIRDALIAKGISADRLTAKGYGETTPIADNKTVNGRRQNRRVVLKVL